MRPSVTSKHKERQDRLRRDMEAYEAAGGKVDRRQSHERARPPVDHWHELVTEDYRMHQESR